MKEKLSLMTIVVETVLSREESADLNQTFLDYINKNVFVSKRVQCWLRPEKFSPAQVTIE